jgi:hypothetical protein
VNGGAGGGQLGAATRVGIKYSITSILNEKLHKW